MKKIILNCLFLSLAFVGYTQTMSVNPSSPYGEGEATDDIIAAEDFFVKNESGSDISFLWRIVRVDVPTEWEISVCDVNLCYDYGVEECPPSKPNEMVAGKANVFLLKFKPHGIAATADFDLILFEKDDPNNIYLTIPITILAETSATNDIVKFEHISIFPNPTSDFFRLSDNKDIDKITINNIIGKEVKSFNANTSDYYSVSELDKGLYIVRLISDMGDVVKVLRLNKR